MAPVLSPEDLVEDEHLESIGFFQRDVHPSEGAVRTVSIPVRFSRTPGSTDRLAPRLGESERLFPGCRSLRVPAEVEVEEDARDAGEGRQSGDDRGDDGGHPA